MRSLLFLGTALLILREGGSLAAPIRVVDLRGSSVTLPTKIAVQTCAGLFNRQAETAGAAYVLLNSKDLDWLHDIEGIVKPALTLPGDFLSHCLQTVAKGVVKYNASSQALILPNIITVAAVLDAVPLEPNDPLAAGVPLVFDALTQLSGFDAYAATDFVHHKFVNLTTTMCKMNPGLDVHHHPINPPLTGTINPGLIDFIVKERLFTFFLNRGCIPLTKEHELMERIVNNNPWPKPIAVYGYDDTLPIAGDLFEAETRCVKEHNMGQIASDGLNNLAFFSRKPPIQAPLMQNREPPVTYNRSKSYLTFILGDGDNMNFLKGSRRDWMLERLQRCQADPSYRGCFPLVWTLSPRTLDRAPDWARWYFNISYATGHDYFVLPPSGDTYSYPGEMSDADQETFVRNTEVDCQLLNCSGTVAWEWFDGWPSAIKHYFPKYAKHGVVKAGFAVNVPYMLPVPSFWDLFKDEFYKVLGGRFVLFRPREWRGTSEQGGGIPFNKRTLLSAIHMAEEVNGYPKGTVTNIYLTSDGGARLSDVYDMVALLDEHVQLVPADTAANLALAAEARRNLEVVI